MKSIKTNPNSAKGPDKGKKIYFLNYIDSNEFTCNMLPGYL
jgi:hypothetical protein